jgi:cytochrome c-type biogenesis protein CcmE|tara:strand:+ start:354 stop:803 length:450 start_codon:yes stop_codon:yes gene_type:complete
MRNKLIFGSIVVALGVVALMFVGVGQSSSRHMTLDALVEETPGEIDGRRIQLAGCTVVPGTIEWDEYRHRPVFQITDGERLMQVRYTGNAVLPDTFQDRAQLVMEGHFLPDQSRFEAEVVMAKCPSKYEGQNYDDHRAAVDEPTSATGS